MAEEEATQLPPRPLERHSDTALAKAGPFTVCATALLTAVQPPSSETHEDLALARATPQMACSSTTAPQWGRGGCQGGADVASCW